MLLAIGRCTFIVLLLFCLFGNTALCADIKAATYTEPTTGMQFVAIPAGSFLMGRNGDGLANPSRKVTIQPFFIGKHEVTFKDYDMFCTEKGLPYPSDEGWGRGKRPVINVNWHQANAFAQWLSEKSDKSFRLPTEAEWEYAAAGGRSSRFPWGERLGRGNANCRNCGSPFDLKNTSTVGSFAPNGYGLHDMAGNVYEWCLDNRHDSYEGAPTDGSAWLGGEKGEWRVNRGGSWYRSAEEAQVFSRCWDKESHSSYELGFRLVMEAF